MTSIGYTRHAETRMQQRGIRGGDVTLILECGTQIDDEPWLMRDRDVKREIGCRKQEIQALERLAHKKLVVRDGHVITVYPSRLDDQKLTLRRGRGKGLAK